MFTERRDYLMDMIERLMERVVAMLRQAKGDPANIEDLERQCERAMDDEFAELDRRMKGLDPRMVAHLVSPVPRLRTYALLCSARVLLQTRRVADEPGADLEAQRVALEPAARRALALVLEAVIESEPTSPDLDAIRLLFPWVDDSQLSPRYLRAIVELASSAGASSAHEG